MMKSVVFALLSAVAVAGGGAHAQTFPTRPVTIVVPYPPGGLIDLVARLIQARFQTELGQSVIIENRSGAGGNVGAEAVARASADGHTLLLANPSLAISPLIYPKLNYKPIEDFAYVGQYGTVPNVLVVHPSIPAKTVQEFIAYAKKNPGKLNYGSPGYGTSPQMSMELFKSMTGANITHVPYKGAPQAVTDVLAGHMNMMFNSIAPIIANIKAGRVRVLGIASSKRSPQLPDVPTISEAGVPGFEAVNWFGMFAPAKTPKPIITRVNEAVVKVLRSPDVQAQFVALGADPVGDSPEEFAAFVRRDMERYAKVVKLSGAKLD